MDSRRRKTITLVVKKLLLWLQILVHLGFGGVVGLDQGGVERSAILADPLCGQPTVITDRVACVRSSSDVVQRLLSMAPSQVAFTSSVSLFTSTAATSPRSWFEPLTSGPSRCSLPVCPGQLDSARSTDSISQCLGAVRESMISVGSKEVLNR